MRAKCRAGSPMRPPGSRGSHLSDLLALVTTEIRAGTPDPIVAPAVGAMEPTTSISWSWMAELSVFALSGLLGVERTPRHPAG